MVWQKEEKIVYSIFIERQSKILVLFLSLFAVLSLRLSYIQIIQGNSYRVISEEQRIYNTRERAPRGIIYADDGNTLAENSFSYMVLFYPFGEEKEPSEEIINELNTILGKNISNNMKNWEYGKVIKLAENISVEKMFQIQEKRLNLKGVSIVKEPKRVYKLSDSSSHLTGYIGEINQNELKYLAQEDYKLGDYIGRGGIEQSFDKYLQGVDGGWQLEVNAKGHQTKIFKHIPPQIGNSVHVTISPKLQKIAYNALKNTPTGKGAAIVIDVKSGAIKAMVSAPGFDANLIGTEEFNQYLQEKTLPLFNRTTQALYAPGSIFKIITAVAALETLKLDPNWSIYCNGKFELGDRVYNCWNKRGHGRVDFKTAIAQSCNVYFYNLALKLGINNLVDFATEFHLGQNTGIDLPNEKRGFVPTPEWKRAKTKVPWLQGDTVIFAIGQGALWVTPLQMAAMITAVANKGEFYKPYAVEEIISSDRKVLYKHKVEKSDPITLSNETWSLLGEALIESVEDGTSRRSKLPNIKVAGKTGTAQNPQGEDHAWFVSYAPADDPEIALAVIVENGGGGGAIAVPVGRAIYEAYFDIPPQQQYYVQASTKPAQTEQSNAKKKR
jgi:penicillin-binding protein 2